MSTDVPDVRRTQASRRAILAGAAAAVAATAARALAAPLPVLAADDNAPIVVGGFYPDATAQTTLANKTNSNRVLWVASNADNGAGNGTAITGFSAKAVGVEGWGVTNTGVYGHSTEWIGVLAVSEQGSAVYASSGSGHAIEAYGAAPVAAALIARGTNGNTAIVGWSGGSVPIQPAKVGVLGHADQDADSRGVFGHTTAGQGVRGEATTGSGVFATATTGIALRVSGKVRLSRSGKASVSAGKSYVDVSVGGGIASNTIITATIQTYRAGVAVAGVRPNYPSTGKARIYLTKVASASYTTPVGWIATEYGS